MSLDTNFRTPEWRPFRTGMFAAMGLTGIFPVVHVLSLYGWRFANDYMGLSWVILQGVLYLVGAGFYAVRIASSDGRLDRRAS